MSCTIYEPCNAKTRLRVKSKIMRQLKNIAFGDFRLLWWLIHVSSHFTSVAGLETLCVSVGKMYQRYMIFGPFYNTFASLFFT